MDSSVLELHGTQEGGEYNVHYKTFGYHAGWALDVRTDKIAPWGASEPARPQAGSGSGFNRRWREADGSLCPFPDQEILAEYRRAGLTGRYPTLGVNDPKAKKQEARLALQKEIKRFCRKQLAPGGSCSPSSVWQAFVTFRAGQAINAIHFGRELAADTGIRRKTPFGIPTYKDIHLKEPASSRRRGV